MYYSGMISVYVFLSVVLRRERQTKTSQIQVQICAPAWKLVGWPWAGHSPSVGPTSEGCCSEEKMVSGEHYCELLFSPGETLHTWYASLRKNPHFAIAAHFDKRWSAERSGRLLNLHKCLSEPADGFLATYLWNVNTCHEFKLTWPLWCF